MKTTFEPAAGGKFLETRISNTEFMNENSNYDTQINEIGGKSGNTHQTSFAVLDLDRTLCEKYRPKGVRYFDAVFIHELVIRLFGFHSERANGCAARSSRCNIYQFRMALGVG